MAFLRDDEFILLMDTPLQSGRMLRVDELQMFRDAGVQTVYWAGPIWDDFMPDDFKTIRWEYFENYLERVGKADLKCIVPLWHKQSKTYPAEFYIKRARGYEFGAFSPWNPEAQAISNRCLEMVRERIASERCLVISAQLDGGERVLLNEAAYYDDYAIADWNRAHWGQPNHKTPECQAWLKESYTRLLVAQQRILVEQEHREIWYQLSRFKPFFMHVSCHGCEHIDHYLAEWQKLETSGFYHISFNYFPYHERLRTVIAEEQERWGVHEFVGAEYCEGLRQGNGRRAIELGMRGMIVGPTHPFTKHDGVERWMVKEITKAVKMFEESRVRHAV